MFSYNVLYMKRDGDSPGCEGHQYDKNAVISVIDSKEKEIQENQ